MFKWTEKFTCKNGDIDSQHKRLFELIDNLYDIVRLKDGYDHYDEIVDIFHQLSDYTVYHFGFEEELFEKYEYDDFHKKIHKLEHKTFINKVSEIDLDKIDENQHGVSLDIVLFVAKWVENHILETDVQFGKFLSEKIKSA